MANEQHIRNFTAKDIAAYHQGRLSAKEMHELEKAALEDPFLADALEGYLTSAVTADADLKDLSSRLRDRVHEEDRAVSPGFTIPWVKVAAMIVVIAGAAMLIYYFGQNKENTQPLAKEDGNQNKIVVTDTAQKNTTAANNENRDSSTYSFDEKNIGGSTQLQFADTTKVDIGNASLDKTATFNLPATADSITGITPGIAAVQETNMANQAAKEKKELEDREMVAKRKAELDNSKAKRLAEAKNDNSLERPLAYKSAPRAIANNGYANARRNDSFKDQYRANNYNVFRGRVTDNANNPLPFVNITNPIDNVGTYSDAKGNFSMIYPDTVLNVNIRSLGFSSKNTQLFNRVADNQIVMQEDRSNLNEVVISNKKINSKTRENNLVLEEPEPADGWSNYDTYLANNLNVPDAYLTKSSGAGEVVLSFEVNKQGQPVDIKVEKSLCETCDKEAIRALKEGPKWKRKAKKGRASVTISF